MKKIIIVTSMMTLLFSCTTINKAMKEPNVRVELNKQDFVLSDQVSAKARSTKVLGIDFERLFKAEMGNVEKSASGISVATIPVIGTFVNDKTSTYALYNLMVENEGYDVVFYPQYETKVVKPVLGLGFIMKITTVETKARLGKLK